MDQELKLWIGGAALTTVLAVVGTGVAVGVAVIGSVNTQISEVRADMRDIRADMRDVRSDIQDVQDRVQGVDDRIQGRLQGVDDKIDAVSNGINAVNTTLLFLTGCIVELEDRPLPITGGTRGDDRTDDALRVAQLDLPESCRTAHTRALEAAQ